MKVAEMQNQIRMITTYSTQVLNRHNVKFTNPQQFK